MVVPFVEFLAPTTSTGSSMVPDHLQGEPERLFYLGCDQV